MLDFQPLLLEDFPRLRKYFTINPGRLCDSTPGSTFIWRDLYRVEYAEHNGSLYFKVTIPRCRGDLPTAVGRGSAGALPHSGRPLL